MSLEQLKEELEKLKYQVRIIGETIDYQAHPVESLILSMDWGEGDIDRAHDIFEKYDNLLEAKEPINWHDFERELKTAFSIGYQTVKLIILAFYKNHQWTTVCYEYAKSFGPTVPIEFHQIIRGVD